MDPNFAPAWAALSQALILNSETMDKEGVIAVIPEARQAATEHLKLIPTWLQGIGRWLTYLGVTRWTAPPMSCVRLS